MAKPLTKEQREFKMQEAWRMRLQGIDQEKIAEDLDIDQGTVSRLLKTMRTRLAKEFEQEAKLQRAEQVASLDYIKQRAITAFTRSEQDTEIDGIPQGRYGDARLLQVAVAAETQKAKILGTEAPKKTELSGPGGKPIEFADTAVLAEAQKELQEWQKQQKEQLAQLNLQSAPPT